MQNAQIWKSIEALCNEAESLIKDGEPATMVIQSIAPPAIAHPGKSSASTLTILSSEPAPPKANIGNMPNAQENLADAPLSPATMDEIAAAIDRASQNAQKPQIIEQPPRGISDRLRKDLMIEVSLAVRSVLENELPKMIRHAISDSLHEQINSSTNLLSNGMKALEATQRPIGKNKKMTVKKRAAPKKDTAKKTKAKKNQIKQIKSNTVAE